MPTQAGTERVVLLDSVLTGTSQWINVQAYNHLAFYFKTDGNPGAGTCVIEECDYDPDTESVGGATMSAIVTVTIDTSVGTDGQYAYHAPIGAYSFVRARIGTDVTVAFLSVVLVAN